jgi:hypothetical protein
VVIVGNVLEFSDALSRPYFLGKVDDQVKEEENVARWRYWQFIKWFAANFVLVIGNSIVSPWYVVHLSLVHFAASLCGYMTRWKTAPEIKGCNLKKYRKTVLDHLRRYWPELILKFEVLVKDPPPSFAWRGPDFQILPRKQLSEEQAASEVYDLNSDKVFVGDLDGEDSESANVSDESKESEEKDQKEAVDSDSSLTSQTSDHESNNEDPGDDMEVDSKADDSNAKDGDQGEKGENPRNVMTGMTTRSQRRRGRSESNGES